MQKNPGLAVVISGLLCMVFIGFILLPAVWLCNIYDAYKSAEKINKGIAHLTQPKSMQG